MRDNDGAYGHVFRRRVRAMCIRDRSIMPHSTWQNEHVERLIGSIRRECLDQLIILDAAHLRRVLTAYALSCSESRTHLALDKNAPRSRPVERAGRIVSRRILGGLHADMGASRPDEVSEGTGIDLTVDNSGAPVDLLFDPMLPSGATIDAATVGSQPVAAELERGPQDEHARLHATAATGRTVVHVGYHGGVLLAPVREPLQLGDASHAPIIRDARLDGEVLTVSGWAVAGHPADIDILTDRRITLCSGGIRITSSPQRYRVDSPEATTPTGSYAPFSIVLEASAAPH